MLETIVAVAAGTVTIAGGLVAAVRWFRRRRAGELSSTLKSGATETTSLISPPIDIVESLRQRLRVNFCTEGPHAGEFVGGREEDMIWQGAKREDAESKPAFYLTYWGWRATQTLLGNAPNAWTTASTQAVSRRLGDKRWITVRLIDYDDPTSPTRAAETVRHTIRAAEILLLLQQEPRLVSQIAWSLVEESRDLMSPEGGWYEFRGEKAGGPSLYASLYAFHFLSTLLRLASRAPVDERERFERAARPLAAKTESFLLRQWTLNKWRYRSVPWEVGTPIVLAELLPFAADAEALQEPVAALLSLLNPTGRLKDPRIGSTIRVSEYMVATRIAYGLHCWYERRRQGRPTAVHHLRAWLLSEYRHDRELTTCEVAFLAELLRS